jgi:hypothetical protein
MLTYEDCLDMSDLTGEEVDAVAEHEHIDRMRAVITADYLAHTSGGERKIRRMIIDDIHHAQGQGNRTHERMLKQVLKHFVETHPRHSPG